MSETTSEDETSSSDVINISTFKSQMEKMLSPKLSPYENCLDIQSKIRSQQNKIEFCFKQTKKHFSTLLKFGLTFPHKSAKI